MKIGAIGIRTKIIVGDAATWHLVKKYIDGKIIDLATDYETLNNKPKINDVELSGNKTSEDLGLVSAVEGKSLVDDLEIEKLAGIEENANNYTHPETHPSSILNVVDVANGDANKFLNERGEMVAVAHENLTDKNSEAAVQHVDITTTKPTLSAADMVAIKDSVTGKMVLTPKSNLLTEVVQSTGESETDVMSQKSVTNELALKELKTNKQNSLAADGTGTKFPTVDAVNGVVFDINNGLAKVFGDYYFIRGFAINKLTGIQEVLSTFKCSWFIPFTSAETLIVYNSNKITNYSNVSFFDATKTFISSLDFSSNNNPATLNYVNTPANTAYVRFNALIDNNTYIYFNGLKSLTEQVAENKSVIDAIEPRVSGNIFSFVGYISKTTGLLVVQAGLKCTDFIPILPTDKIYICNTVKSGGCHNVTFFTSTKTLISGLDLSTAQAQFYELNSTNIPATATFMRLNALTTQDAYYVKNGIKDLGQLSLKTFNHAWYAQKFTSFGDSITASGEWQAIIARNLNCVSYIRGVGSSSVTANFTPVAVKPDGTYIDRRSLYASNELYLAALAAAGYTNDVVSPTWATYSSNPTGYTLPTGSYFSINSQASSDDRVQTIPLDSAFVAVLFGTNDDKTTIGEIDDYGDLSGDGGTVSFIGSYRQMLQKIHTRVPSAKIILCVPPKKADEYAANARTAEGIAFDNLRAAIRLIGITYGYEVIDFSQVINYSNLATKLSDGVHPNVKGYALMGNHFSFKAITINSGN